MQKTKYGQPESGCKASNLRLAKKHIYLPKRIQAFLYLLPVLILFLFVTCIPLVRGFLYSFTNWSGSNSEIQFVGFDNYIRIFKDRVFVIAFRNTFILTICVTLLQNAAGIGLALALNNSAIVGKSFYRAILFLPSLIGSMVLGNMWKILLSPVKGPFSVLLTALGVENKTAYNIFNSPIAAMALVIFTMVWQFAGYDMVIYLAGLQAIPKDLYEACALDGASAWQRFSKVTFPLLMPSVTICTFLNVIGCLKCFEHVYVLTNGGPANQTETIGTYLYNTAFSGGQIAYGTAISTVLFIVIFIVALIQLKLTRSKEVEM